MNYEKSSNILGGLLKGFAGAVIILGFISGIIVGAGTYSVQWGVFFLYIVISLISGLFLASFGEIIILLQTSCDKQHEILLYLKENGSSLPAASASEIRKDAVEPEAHEPTVVSEVPDNSSSAVFPSRPANEIICPHCGLHQPADRNCCFKCGTPFIFDNERSNSHS